MSRRQRFLEWLRDPIVVGPPDCPIFYRWAIIGGGFGRPLIKAERYSVKVHHFLPSGDDRDVHDHPWAFWTLVLWGYYDDLMACPECDGDGRTLLGRAGVGRVAYWCPRCDGNRAIVRERMRFGKLRFRPANHAHRTKAGPRGCWTLVVTGPKVRTWGFWRRGRFWTHKEYEEEFGFAMRCDDLEKEYRR